jgi:tetratricopeptide (TPR) repeat protein
LTSKETNQEEKTSKTVEPDVVNQKVIPVALPLAPDITPAANVIKTEDQKPNTQPADATPAHEEPKNLKPKEPSLVKEKIPEDPIRLYREGNFDGAAKIWHQTCRLHPMDPNVRNNLALAYFQLGDKDRAIAYGLSAYLIAPSALTVAWNTRIFVQSADQLDGSVMSLWNDRGAEWLTGRLGVFGWQAALILAMTIGVLGLGLVLASGYFTKNRAVFFRTGVATFLIGLFLLSGAIFTLSIYGKLADRSAVMIVDVEPLRSIPSELEPQAEKAYPPGSIAHLEKSFLGWSKIRLPNHDMGWIRTEHIVPLY